MLTLNGSLRDLWRKPIRVNAPGTGKSRNVHRASVEVAGESVWFESSDVSLSESVEAIGSAFLIPAAALGKRLTFGAPVDSVWLNNVKQAQQIVGTWWGFTEPINGASPSTLPTASLFPPSATGLCFTGGVDSFYSLLRGEFPISHLVYVHGFDAALTDRERAQATEASVRAVAEERRLQPVLVSTNLRTHRTFRKTNWEQSHGGALAAIGHLLSDHVSQLLVSASYPKVFDRPWGSHWTLDPWWSSSRLKVVHVGAEKWRAEKLVAIMSEPLVQQHLRVCWENRSPTGNCGQCEKCLRTMLVLDGHGFLEKFPVFPGAEVVAANLERLSVLKDDLIRVYDGFLELDLTAKVRSALVALLQRSKAARSSGRRPNGNLPEAHWDRDTLQSRIADAGTRQRHSGGSPDPNEIAAYRAGLGRKLDATGTALVLGMTPELRGLALSRFRRLISVDSNPQSIALYRDWIEPADRPREITLESDWFSLPKLISQPVAAALGDGIFGNLPDYESHRRLLQTIKEVLLPAARFVTRMALIPDGFDPAAHSASRLLERFRSGQSDEAEFGFGMRLVGHYESCYDAKTALLDNARLFAHCAARHAAGEFTDAEHAAIRRYYFGGFNCILSQRDWERLLVEGGWQFKIHRCHGKAWYEYYPVYSCWRMGDPAPDSLAHIRG